MAPFSWAISLLAVTNAAASSLPRANCYETTFVPKTGGAQPVYCRGNDANVNWSQEKAFGHGVRVVRSTQNPPHVTITNPCKGSRDLSLVNKKGDGYCVGLQPGCTTQIFDFIDRVYFDQGEGLHGCED